MTTRQDTEKGATYDPATQPAPAPDTANIAEDFIDIFYTPATVFARRAASGYGLTLLIVAVISALFTFAARSAFMGALEADMTRAMAGELAKHPEITQAQLDAGRNMQLKISMFMMLIGTPIAVVIVAFFAWLSAKFVSAKISWQQAMLIVTLAYIPRLLNSLIVAVQGLLTDTSNIDSMMKLTFSPARFMNPEASRALIALASRFDVFVLWSTVLIAIGVAVMGKVPRAKGYAAGAIVWLIATLLATVPALIAG